MDSCAISGIMLEVKYISMFVDDYHRDNGIKHLPCGLQDLAVFASKSFQTVLDACTDDFKCLEERLDEFRTIRDPSQTERKDDKSLTQTVDKIGTLSHKNEEKNTLDDFAFTISAARRSEKRRLVNYVRMSDYMICDTLYAILVESARVRIGNIHSTCHFYISLHP